MRSRDTDGPVPSADRLELLERLLRTEGIEPSEAAEIRRCNGTGPVPVSFAQRRLWFLDQLAPGQAVYDLSYGARLSGVLDVGALERALDEVVHRHESLRTTFAVVDSQPVQVVAPALRLALPVIDLGALPEGEWESAVRQHADEEARRPFDLTEGPLLRVLLLARAAQEHALLLTMHHIVSDGWSMGVLLRELGALYGAFLEGRPSPLPELPLQYADYSQWQRERLQGELLERELAYWRSRLGEAPPPLELPADRPRPVVQSFRGAREEFTLSGEVVERLRALCRREGATLFMGLLAAFQALLCRYTGQEDIVVGTPIAGRDRAELEGLIGFFVNTLVLRTDLSGEPSFRELLGRVREVALGAYAHPELPFERLVEELQPQRDLGRNPLFQVAVASQDAAMGALELPGVAVRPLEVDNATSKFDLTLMVEAEEAEGLRGSFEYSTDLFDRERVVRMVGHFATLLRGMVEEPERPLSRLALLTEAEQRQLLEWSGARHEYPQPACLHELFEAQEKRTPDSVAVVCEDQSLTYRELDRRANRLAHRLRRLGVGPEVLVGICIERSLDMVVGILGILKAGAAYLPLDPDSPKDRLAFMLEDARVPVLLTQQRLLGALPPHPARVLCLDSDSEAIARESDAGLASGATANGLAYVIYTSGSSGRPKGVLVTHRNVTRLFAATRAWFHFGESDVWTLFHSYAFDFSVWELWGALLHGGRLVVVPYWVSRSPETFYDLLAAERVTILNQTPSAFRQLVRAEEGKGRGDLALRLVVFGGEALEPQSLRPWFDRHPDDAPRLVNMYGITETTVHVTYRPLAAVDAVGSGSVIGRPLPDLQLYLLDRHLQPVPIGVPGEMYVGGAGLARGYLNRPELTAVRFLPNPFAGGQGSLYKSGDLARYLPNGDVEYLGRIDDQVKIRGFRVEPGEIAAVLTGCPGVREAVVVVRQEVSGEKRLAAYAVPAKGEAITVAGLRHYLKEKLPEYMLPAAVVLLDALPLTANGKLDRRALPAPDWSGATGQAYVPPRTPLEEAIAGIWSEVLGLPRVGIHDSFFDLGGHSLLATQIVSRLRQALGVELSLRCLFEAPTIADLAPAVAESRRGPQEPHALRRIHRHDAQGALARVDKLAEDEVDSWLGKMLDEGEGQE